MKNVNFTEKSYDDFINWSQTDKKLFRRIDQLIKSISRTPYKGIGKHEPLKHQLAGFWSRKINDKHRLVYRITSNNEIEIAKCRNHY
jgi:toxin YoeB